jgi:hypothetical protein
MFFSALCNLNAIRIIDQALPPIPAVESGKATTQNIVLVTKETSGIYPSQSLGQPQFEELQPAFRFGYAARLAFNGEYFGWDNVLEIQLAEDWQTRNDTKQSWSYSLISKVLLQCFRACYSRCCSF